MNANKTAIIEHINNSTLKIVNEIQAAQINIIYSINERRIKDGQQLSEAGK